MKRQKAIILLGGNLGDTESIMLAAEKDIMKHSGIVTGRSSLYKTAAWGPVKQQDFLNRAIAIQTVFTPLQLLGNLLATESRLGRKRHEKYGPRTIDIDIIFYGDQVIRTTELSVPHPHMAERRFVLVPCNELVPRMVHPLIKKSVSELLNECNDPLEVWLWKA